MEDGCKEIERWKKGEKTDRHQTDRQAGRQAEMQKHWRGWESEMILKKMIRNSMVWGRDKK